MLCPQHWHRSQHIYKCVVGWMDACTDTGMVRWGLTRGLWLYQGGALAHLGRGRESHGGIRMGGEMRNLFLSLAWQLALTLTRPTMEQLGGRAVASLPSGGWVACGSPSVFQLPPGPLSFELKIAGDGSARTHCPLL